MRLVHANGEFWNGVLAGKSVRATWSTKGKESRQTFPFKTAAAAKNGFAGLVKKLSGLGYRPEVPAGVLEALSANPRDASSLAVLADALQSTSDPRGELAALVLARKEKSVARFLEDHGPRLFGPALEDVEAGHLIDLSWTPGFLFGLTVDSEAGEPKPQVEVVRRLVRAPVASLLREVHLFAGGDVWSRSVEELAQLPHPEVLSSLRLDGSQIDLAEGEWDAGDFGDVWHCFPSLRALWLAGTSMQQGTVGALTNLRTFSRVGCRPSAAELEELATLERLEHLELGFRPPARGEELPMFPSSLCAALKKALRLPLRSLCLRDVELTTQLLATVFESPAFRTLRTLDLGDCEVDDECAEYLRDEKAALAKLEHVSSPTFGLEEFGDRFDDEGVRNRGEAVLRAKNLVEDAWSLRA